MRTPTLLFFSTSLVSILACGGDASDTGALDTGVAPADTDNDTDTDTDADADTDTDTDSDTDTVPPPPPVFWELGDPCSGATPYAIYFEDEQSGWVGCGSGMGLWRTTDAGDTFTAGHPSSGSGDFYVNQIVPDPLGGMLVCGHDYSSDPDPLLYRYRDGEWTTLLTYGANWNDPGSAQMSNCGVVAAAGDGTLLVASETVGDMTRSTDDGLTWTAEYRYWEEANLDEGGYSYYYMLNLVAAGGAYFGAGSRIVEPPVFFSASDHAAADWYNFQATTISDAFPGEVWALATPDDGVTWFAGGRDQSSGSASGFFFRSDDAGVTWTDISLGGSVDIMHDVKFAADGLHGIAVGHRYPPGSLGGFIALTEDGGQTWTEREEVVPPLYAAAIVGETFWVSGDGYLARGVFEAE